MKCSWEKRKNALGESGNSMYLSLDKILIGGNWKWHGYSWSSIQQANMNGEADQETSLHPENLYQDMSSQPPVYLLFTT